MLKDHTENLSKHVLSAAGETLSERSGKLAINGIEKLYKAIVRDGKYTKKEQWYISDVSKYLRKPQIDGSEHLFVDL